MGAGRFAQVRSPVYKSNESQVTYQIQEEVLSIEGICYV